jgi:hypothetical protein
MTTSESEIVDLRHICKKFNVLVLNVKYEMSLCLTKHSEFKTSIFYFLIRFSLQREKKGGFLCSARHHFAPFFLFVESDNSHTVLQRTKLLRLLLP